MATILFRIKTATEKKKVKHNSDLHKIEAYLFSIWK